MEEVVCNLCTRNQTVPLFSKWDFSIVKCGSCGLVYVTPRSFSIESEDYFRGAYLSTIEPDGAIHPGIQRIYSQIVERLESYLIPGELLDVGCAMGHFMHYAEQKGWNVRGVECSAYAAAYGREKYSLRIEACCDLRHAQLADEAFDACVLIEVAEHLPDPRSTFMEVFRVLKPGGVLYVTTPNFASFRSLLLREQWSAVIPTGHLYYFTAESMAAMLKSVGFSNVSDLTAPASVSNEVAFLRSENTLQLGPTELAQLESRTSYEDMGKFSNGRGEGLVFWAVKPSDTTSAVAASVRGRKIRPELEGKLISGSGVTSEDQKVYYVAEGRKHWVTSGEWLDRKGLRLEDTFQLNREEMDSIFTGPELI